MNPVCDSKDYRTARDRGKRTGGPAVSVVGPRLKKSQITGWLALGVPALRYVPEAQIRCELQSQEEDLLTLFEAHGRDHVEAAGLQGRIEPGNHTY